MKSILLNEEQVKNPCIIAEQIFNDELDPRSLSYVRKLNRPTINWLKIFFYSILPILLSVVLFVLFRSFGLSVMLSSLVSIAVFLIYIVFAIKPAVVCCIKIYQRYAPDRIRNKCRFEPSCSEYMLIVIRKYGLIKGVKKGIHRLKRCNVNDGGFDFPE